jgi:hypothetical protein
MSSAAACVSARARRAADSCYGDGSSGWSSSRSYRHC